MLVVSAAVGYFLLDFEQESDEQAPMDLQAYLGATHEMTEQGKYAEALARYIWFHEHAREHDPSMSGVRLSFALCGWRRLADEYPPALEALVETRDRAVAKVRAGTGNWEVFNDLQSLNRHLDDDALTVELFEYLHENQPALADRVWTTARSEVIASGNYELAWEYIGNPMHELAAIRRSYEREYGQFDDDEEFAEFYQETQENRFVERTVDLIAVVARVGREDLAEQIGAEALETFWDPRIERAIGRDP